MASVTPLTTQSGVATAFPFVTDTGNDMATATPYTTSDGAVWWEYPTLTVYEGTTTSFRTWTIWNYGPSPDDPTLTVTPTRFTTMPRTRTRPSPVTTITVPPTSEPGHGELKKRDPEIVVDLGGHTLTASQYPTVTTGWWESVRPDGIHTWVAIPFTQTFATTVLDQLGGPQSGSIGLPANATGTPVDRFATDVDGIVLGVEPSLRRFSEGTGEENRAFTHTFGDAGCSRLIGVLLGLLFSLAAIETGLL